MAVSPWVQQLGREAVHSPPSTPEVKNGGAVPPLSHMSSWPSAELIKHRDFTIYIYTHIYIHTHTHTSTQRERERGVDKIMETLRN
jgi:hypothetical protein